MDYRYYSNSRQSRGLSGAGPSSTVRNNQTPPYPPYFRTENRDNHQFAHSKKRESKKKWHDRDGRETLNNFNRLPRSNSVSSESSSLRDSGTIRRYTCPKCKHLYNYAISNNTLSGKVPRILPCKHTVCEECINKCFKATNHIECATCSKKEYDKKALYDFNHHILGQIVSSRFNKTVIDFPNIALTSADTRSQTSLDSDKFCLNPNEKCGFSNCENTGYVSCVDCSGLYCKDCDDALHNSGKLLASHKRVPLENNSLELNKCSEHNEMVQDIFCEDCKVICCCYCFIKKHEGHSKNFLGCLSESEEQELIEACEKAKKTRAQLAVSQKKISKIGGNSTEVSELELEIAQRFADVHAHLHYVEKQLQEEAKLLRNSNDNLGGLSQTISSDIAVLDRLIHFVEERKNVKFNMKLLLDILRIQKDLPTVLVSNEISEKPKLVVAEEIQELDKYFKLEVSQEVTYKLIEVDELPLEYQEAEIEAANCYKKLQCQNTNSIITGAQSQNSLNTEVSSNSKSKHYSEIKQDRFRQQLVFVTHINSLESFYVQFKDDNNRFKQLEQELKNHAMKTPVGVDEVVMKELYLAKRLGRWARVRVMEKFDIGSEERFRIKFIDFGNTSIVSKDSLMYISSSIAKKKPFAVECKLDNPSHFEWPKDTHFELAKMLDVNKELLMYIKEVSNNINTVILNINTSTGTCSVIDLLIFGCDAMRMDPKKTQPIQESLQSNRLYDNSDVFDVGTSYKVFIRYISDPWHIYFQKTLYETSFNSLIEQMEDYYNKTTCDIHVPIENSFVVVYHKSKSFGKWHRAKILRVCDKNMVKVFLVDIGQQLQVSWRSLRKLAEIFKKSECLVVPMKLADVDPTTSDTWNKEVIDYLAQYAQRNVQMKILVSNNEPLEVILFKPGESYDLNINALLVEKELAHSTGTLTDTLEWLRTEETSNSESNILFIKDDTDEEEDIIEYECIQQVEIIRFENPFSFYVSFVTMRKENDKLLDEIQIHYKTQKRSPVKNNWQENEKVVVYDKTDNMYYRGIIRSVDDNKYCVDLIDKPANLWVTSDSLRVILPYFKDNFPNIVFRCHMFNVKPAGDSSKWSHLSLEWFEMLFKKHNDIFLQKVEDDKSRSSIPVTLWYSKLIQGAALEPSFRKYYSIDKKVVNAGLAFWTNNPLPKITRKKSQEQISEETENKTNSEETVITPAKMDIETVKIKEWLPPSNFKANDFYGYITCAENKGYLYIREEKMQKCYKEMEKNMEEYFKTIPNNPFIMRENQMVTVRCDNLYYRSTILKVISPTQASIFMIDFGSDHIVEITDIYNKIMYPKIPMMVKKIQLYDVCSDSDSWTDEEVDCLINIAAEYSRFVIRSGPYTEIPLADVFDINGVCLNDEIVKQCPNLYRSTSKKPDHDQLAPPSIISAEPETGEQVEIKEEVLVEEKDSELETLESEEQKLSTEEIKEEDSDETLTNENEIKLYTYAKFPQEPSKMDIIDVYDYKTVSLYNPDNLSKEEDFENLIKTIRENVDSVEPLDTDNIEVGMPCLSLYKDDQEWYRAKIIRMDVQQCGYVSIIYVDYGNFDIVKTSSLKSMKPEWLHFPARFVDATIDYKLLRTDQEIVLSTHIKGLSEETKYVKVISEDPVLIHVYEEKDDALVHYYEVFIENGIVAI